MSWLVALFGGVSVWRWLLLIFSILLIILLLVARADLIARGGSAALDGVRNANDAAEARANTITTEVLACPPGQWNQRAGTCER